CCSQSATDRRSATMGAGRVRPRCERLCQRNSRRIERRASRMKLQIPELSLVVLIGCSGSRKSTFARRHFKPTEVLSSDFCRGLVSDDENNQSATGDAFDVLQHIAGKRLARGLLTVVDATNVQPEARKPLIELAREHDVLAAAI